MALKLNERYPQRWDSPSNDYPQGAFKNLTELGEQDGSYLEQDWLNDYSGFFGALLRNAEMTPDGTIDTAQRSQFYDALIKVARTNIVTKDNITSELGNSTELVASQKLVNDTKINLDNSVSAAVTKADSAQSRADSAYNLANSKWSPQETIGNGRLMREGAQGGVLSNLLISRNFADSLPTMNSFVVGNSEGDDNFWKYARGFEVVDDLGEGGRLGILNDEVRHMYYNPVDKKYYWVTHLTDKNNQQIGVGQTWVDVTSQRTNNTYYTNSTNKPIVVIITSDVLHSAGDTGVRIEVDGVLLDFGGKTGGETSGAGLNFSGSCIVPPGSKYKSVNGNGVKEWYELR